jgi:hypothetical protein
VPPDSPDEKSDDEESEDVCQEPPIIEPEDQCCEASPRGSRPLSSKSVREAKTPRLLQAPLPEVKEEENLTKVKTFKLGEKIITEQELNDLIKQGKEIKRFVINVKQTRYPIVKKVARKGMNWKLKYFAEDKEGPISKTDDHCYKVNPVYDLTWHDTAITVDFF